MVCAARVAGRRAGAGVCGDCGGGDEQSGLGADGDGLGGPAGIGGGRTGAGGRMVGGVDGVRDSVCVGFAE